MYVAAGAEVIAVRGKHHGMHIGCIGQVTKGIAQLGVALECQRVLALWAIQPDNGDITAHFPNKVLGGQVSHALHILVLACQ